MISYLIKKMNLFYLFYLGCVFKHFFILLYSTSVQTAFLYVYWLRNIYSNKMNFLMDLESTPLHSIRSKEVC